MPGHNINNSALYRALGGKADIMQIGMWEVLSFDWVEPCEQLDTHLGGRMRVRWERRNLELLEMNLVGRVIKSTGVIPG